MGLRGRSYRKVYVFCKSSLGGPRGAKGLLIQIILKGAPICCGGCLHFGRVLGFARFGGPEIRFLEAFLG